MNSIHYWFIKFCSYMYMPKRTGTAFRCVPARNEPWSQHVLFVCGHTCSSTYVILVAFPPICFTVSLTASLQQPHTCPTAFLLYQLSPIPAFVLLFTTRHSQVLVLWVYLFHNPIRRRHSSSTELVSRSLSVAVFPSISVFAFSFLVFFVFYCFVR